MASSMDHAAVDAALLQLAGQLGMPLPPWESIHVPEVWNLLADVEEARFGGLPSTTPTPGALRSTLLSLYRHDYKSSPPQLEALAAMTASELTSDTRRALLQLWLGAAMNSEVHRSRYITAILSLDADHQAALQLVCEAMMSAHDDGGGDAEHGGAFSSTPTHLHVATLEEQIEELRARNAELSQHNAELMEQVTRWQGGGGGSKLPSTAGMGVGGLLDAGTSDSKLSMLQSSVSLLEAQLAEATSLLHEREASMIAASRSWESERSSLREELKMAADEVDVLRSQAGEVRRLEREGRLLKAKADRAAELERAVKSLEAAAAEAAEKMMVVQSEAAESRDLAAKVTTLEHDHIAMQAALNDAKMRLAAQEADLTRARSERNEWLREKASLQSALAEAAAHAASLQKSVAANEATVATAASDAAAAQARLIHRAETAEAAMQEARRQVAELQSAMSKATTKEAEEAAELRKQVAELTVRRQDLASDLALAESRCATLTASLEASQADLKRARADAVLAEERASTSEAAARNAEAAMTRRAEAAEVALQEARREIHALQAAGEAAAVAVAAASTVSTKEAEEAAELRKQVAELTVRRQDLASDLALAESRCATLTASLEASQADLKRARADAVLAEERASTSEAAARNAEAAALAAESGRVESEAALARLQTEHQAQNESAITSLKAKTDAITELQRRLAQLQSLCSQREARARELEHSVRILEEVNRKHEESDVRGSSLVATALFEFGRDVQRNLLRGSLYATSAYMVSSPAERWLSVGATARDVAAGGKSWLARQREQLATRTG